MPQAYSALRSKTALVTGGTDGIGKEVARGLAAEGHRVIVVGRDAEKGERAVSELKKETGSTEVFCESADLSLIRNTHRLADQIVKRFPRIHYLVLGAVVVRGEHQLTAEGIEYTFALNYLSRFAMTWRLMPALAAAGKPTQSAHILLLNGAAQGGKIHWNNVNLANNFSTIRSVLQFCTANDIFTIEMDRRRKEEQSSSHVTINCLKIGVVKTNIRREFPLWMKILVPIVFDPILGQTPHEVARTVLRLILDEEFERVSGALFLKIKKFRQATPHKAAADPRIGQRLFELSERMIAQATMDPAPAQITPPSVFAAEIKGD